MQYVKNLIISLRPSQWLKNFFVFAGILFSHNIFNTAMLWRSVYAFLIFCLLSGVVYIMNDLLDIDTDKRHPVKCKRPLASGALSICAACRAIGIFVPLILFFSYCLSFKFFIVILSYLILQIAYSFFLKHIVILDVLIISSGFVFRVAAGAVVIDVEISSWLFICTILLSLFLALSKRRHELLLLKGTATHHRRILEEYSPYLLDQMISVVTASTVVSYALYTNSAETIEKFGTKSLTYTIPFVIYGIFRYLYLIHKMGSGGDPEKILMKDIPLLANIVLWIVSTAVIIYR